MNDTPQTPPVEPEKDEHGCIIGEETFDEETQKCVPIATPQTPVTAESIKEQGLSADEIKQKLADLNKQKSEIDAKLYPEAELSDEERATLRAQVDVIWAEISAYEKALAALYITSEVPTDTTPLPETITEQHDSTEPEPCPEGQHRDETGKCVPNEKLEEKIFEADYPWDKCIADMKAQGHDEDSANKICAAIKNRTVTHEMQFENCSASEAIKKIAEKLKTDKIFAYNISKFVEQLTGEQENPQSPAITSGETACPEGQHRNEAGICVPDEVPPQITENKVGPYASFEDCVAANQDKDNPEAYCASICQEAAQKQIITLRKELVNAKAELAEAKKLTENTEKRLTRLRERIKSVMPPLMAKRSWSWGPQRFVSEIESVLKREE